MKNRKNIIITATLALALVLPMQAQVFIMEDETNEFRNETEVNGGWNNVIVHGSTDDQTNFVPIGNGLLVMTILGVCYFTRKKKDNN